MTNDIVREKADALIARLACSEAGTAAVIITSWNEFAELKAALRPSREGIADYLQGIINSSYLPERAAKWLGYAIEELRQPMTNQED